MENKLKENTGSKCHKFEIPHQNCIFSIAISFLFFFLLLISSFTMELIIYHPLDSSLIVNFPLSHLAASYVCDYDVLDPDPASSIRVASSSTVYLLITLFLHSCLCSLNLSLLIATHYYSQHIVASPVTLAYHMHMEAKLK